MAKKIDDALKKAKELRRKNYEASLKSVESSSKEDFRVFFSQSKNKLNLDPKLEEIIWLHFKAAGFDKKDKFEEGLAHFGIKK